MLVTCSDKHGRQIAACTNPASSSPMPAQPWVEPDLNTYDGRGWEPERTWHTPRRDSSSVKGPSGRWVPQSELARPDWYGSPGVLSSRAGGKGGQFTPSPGERRAPPVEWPQRGSWGAPGFENNPGFHPDLRPRHGERDALPFEAPMPMRRASTPPPSRRGIAPQHPLMMDGLVTLQGRIHNKNLHHRPGYESPDRALVGAEEAAARAKADKQRLRERAARAPQSNGLGAAALDARRRALAAAERRRIAVPGPQSGLLTNKLHNSHEAPVQRVATPTTMAREAGY